jgi:hypothetical protein
MVLCEGKEVCSHLIEHVSSTTRILGSANCKGLELWRLTSSEKVKISMSWRAKGLKVRICSVS